MNQRNASYSNFVFMNINVNKRRMNINITALCGLPEGVNAVFKGRKFDQVNQSNRRIIINCIRISILRYVSKYFAVRCGFGAATFIFSIYLKPVLYYENGGQ